MRADTISATPEMIPEWLLNFTNNDRFDRDAFFKSRIVYYPGSGVDGQPVKHFGSRSEAHCFVYTDYLIEPEAIKKTLDDPENRFHGYRTIHRQDLSLAEIYPGSWVSHIPSSESAPRPHQMQIQPYAFLEILERIDSVDETYGPQRLCILFIGDDGHMIFDALFCQSEGSGKPYAIVLQDHSCGGNYSNFGAGGLMHTLAKRTNIFPPFLMVADNTIAWDEYVLSDPESKTDRKTSHKRAIYKLMNPAAYGEAILENDLPIAFVDFHGDLGMV